MGKQPQTIEVPAVHVHYIDVNDLSKRVKVTVKMEGAGWMAFTTYDSPHRIESTDILYRKTDVPGSYIFYYPRHLDCKKMPAHCECEFPYQVRFAREKMKDRKHIAYHRDQLQAVIDLPH